jgi:quinol-cytochrome oxidoreductase complex cytochrome b subunit
MTEKRAITWKERLAYSRAANDDSSRVRAVLNNAILHLHPTTVPAAALRWTYTWGLGGISALLALLLGLTGVLLMFRYDASIGQAYLSIQALESRVIFGSLIRAVHHWSANLLVISTGLHLVRVFFSGGYKRGRAMNWWIGVALLVLVLAFNFTGYLLPWDQLAYWAITVSTSLFSYLPVVGASLGQLLMGGSQVGQGTLRNFYALHVAVLPVLLVAALAYHFWKIRKNGGLSQPEGVRSERLTTLPHLVQVEFAAAAVVTVAVLLFAMYNPAPLGELANPSQSPNPAKAAWYFLGLQELLLHMHSLAAIGLVGLGLVGLFLVPLLDRCGEDIGIYFRSKKGRWAALLGAFLALDLTPLLVAADEYWLDLAGLFPTWPNAVANGVLPLALTILGLAGVYGLVRLFLKANHSEGLVGLFAFVLMGLVVLTVIGVYFRGANMALVVPF